MSKKQETIADIVAEMRVMWQGCKDCPCDDLTGADMLELADRIEAAHKREIEEIESDGIAKGINSMSKVCLKHGYFDDKHIVNGAKMREVVELLARVILPLQEEYPAEYGGGKVPDKDGWLAWIRQMQVRACVALATHPRNCDVGTAEEQVERFNEYCQSNMQYYCDMFGTHEDAGGWDCKEECPIGKMVDKNEYLGDHCQLLWAQMPYEEGGAK